MSRGGASPVSNAIGSRLSGLPRDTGGSGAGQDSRSVLPARLRGEEVTVFELRELARIIGRATAAMANADADMLVTSMWRFLRKKNPDLSRQAWQNLVAEAREDLASRAAPSAGAPAENADAQLAADDAGQQAEQGFPNGPLGSARTRPPATARPANRDGDTRSPRKR
jgi:hypothetical protein